mmetsp:Transcript_43621/g.48875  ORF Transcript_43621/g.48875 Transcript_43621/m.48875 type:complete len:380 (+) Transcript_43621:129-1268(+)
MQYTEEEAKPLMTSRRTSHGNDNGPRRRQPIPQHASMQNLYSSSNSVEDFSKTNDKTSSLIHRCFRNLNTCRSCVCARPELNTKTIYYEDTFNDEPWDCTFGTSDQDGIWVNFGDQVGTVMGSMVWILIIYSVLTISLLAHNQKLPNGIAMMYGTICTLMLACHAKTTFTDPGSIPQEAVPREALFRKGITTHAMCSHCQTYKPPLSHHCRICNRCISKMDHHCPWMNNCVGANNFKHFILFLCYTWIGCAFALIIFALNYFFCNSEDCTFDNILVQLVRVMTVLCIATFLFVSSMIMNVTYGIMTGVGTIDRLKKKAGGTMNDSEQEPIPLKDVFGIQGYWTWIFPIDPVFEDYDLVVGYSIPQRLMREKKRDTDCFV